MRRLRDSSEVREAVDLLDVIIKETPARDGADVGARGERLRRILVQLCARAGFAAAAVADGDGLPLASHNLPFTLEEAGALTSILGEALRRVASVSGHKGASSISVDVSLADKLVVRRFAEADATFYLMVRCPLSMDEHAEIEVSIDEIAALVRGV